MPNQRAASVPGALPTITLVTPVLNGWRYIAEAIESVLRQDYPALEYIVVDGGSTDGTLDIIQSYARRTDFPQRIARVIPGPDTGMYDAVGKGLAAGSGEVLGYLNCDDLLEPGALLHAGRHFAASPGADAIYHDDIVLMNGWKYANYAQPSHVGAFEILQGHILNQAGVFFRRALYDRAGGVRREFRMAGDYDLFLRMAAKGRFEKGVAHLSVFRVRPGQLSGDMDAYVAEVEKARAAFLASLPAWRRELFKMRRRFRPKYEQFRPRRYGTVRPFFPLDFDNMGGPSPRATWSAVPGPARSPVDGQLAERFLLTVPGTRGTVVETRHFHLDTRHRIAVSAQPALARDPRAANAPAAVSPFAHHDTRRLWHKALFRAPLERMPRRLVPLVGITDPTASYLQRVLAGAGVAIASPLRVLDVAAGEGRLLRELSVSRPWRLAGLGVTRAMAWTLRAKGHEVWEAPAGALEALPSDARFDVIVADDYLDRIETPREWLDLARARLAPGGVVVATFANLDSRLLEWFGPTWGEWDAPRRRFVASRQGVRDLAAAAGFDVLQALTFSPATSIAATLVSVESALHRSALRTKPLPPHIEIAARRVAFWMALAWNRLGRGERIAAVLRPTPR